MAGSLAQRSWSFPTICPTLARVTSSRRATSVWLGQRSVELCGIEPQEHLERPLDCFALAGADPLQAVGQQVHAQRGEV